MSGIVGGLMFYQGLFLLLSLFRQLPTEVAEQNSTIYGHMVSLLPTNQGSKDHLPSTISLLNGKFNGLYLRNET